MNFENISDSDLKAMADHIFADLCIAASVSKDSDWHAGAFCALHEVTTEMCLRGMRP